MEFWDHLNKAKGCDCQGLSETLVNHFSDLLRRGHSVADLLAHYGDDFGHLPAERLRQLSRAHVQYQLWTARLRQLAQVRADAGLEALPARVYEGAPQPDQLDAVVRTARLSARCECDSGESWLAVLQAGVELWTRSMSRARRHGSVSVMAKDPADPQNDDYDPYVRFSSKLEQVAPHQWLAIRRGEREGVLVVDIELTEANLIAEAERLKPRLGDAAQARDPASLLQELVLDDLIPWLKRVLDGDSQDKAIDNASRALVGLLRSSQVQARQIGAVYAVKAGGRAAAVIVDRTGDLLAQRIVKAEGKWVDRCIELFRTRSITHVAVPSTTSASELLGPLEEQLTAAGYTPAKIRAAAIAEARIPLTDPPLRLGPMVASAVVIARRALDPLKEWANVDPVSIGIAEYQNDLDADLLRAALNETLELCKLERRRGKRVAVGGGVSRASTAMARLNPLVKTMTDLRPGMAVHGVITNISHFGAFVNLGLPQEALVHISELSDEFVATPNDVVTIGQQVSAHVLAVDPSRGRISLTLRTQTRRRPERVERTDLRSSAPRREPAANRELLVKPSSGPKTKSEALANLEKLFKK